MKKRLVTISFCFFMVLVPGVLFFSPAAFAKSSHRILENLLEDIEDKTEDMIDDYEDHLKKEDRWEAFGVDLELYDALNTFYRDAVRLEIYFDKKQSFVILETPISRLLRRADDVVELLTIVPINEQIEKDWDEIWEKVEELSARFYGVDDRFEDTPAETDGVEKGLHGFSVKKVKRLSEADIDFAADQIRKLDLLSTSFVETFETSELIMRFEGAVNDLRSVFRSKESKIKALPEVKTVLRLGHEVEAMLAGEKLPPKAEKLWTEISRTLEAIAEAYNLQREEGEENGPKEP